MAMLIGHIPICSTRSVPSIRPVHLEDSAASADFVLMGMPTPRGDQAPCLRLNFVDETPREY